MIRFINFISAPTYRAVSKKNKRLANHRRTWREKKKKNRAGFLYVFSVRSELAACSRGHNDITGTGRKKKKKWPFALFSPLAGGNTKRKIGRSSPAVPKKRGKEKKEKKGGPNAGEAPIDPSRHERKKKVQSSAEWENKKKKKKKKRTISI